MDAYGDSYPGAEFLAPTMRSVCLQIVKYIQAVRQSCLNSMRLRLEGLLALLQLLQVGMKGAKGAW